MNKDIIIPILSAGVLIICGCESKKEKSLVLCQQALEVFHEDVNQAEILFRDAYKLDTLNTKALKGLVEVNIKKNDLQEAMEYYKKYIDIEYYNDSITLLLVPLLIQQGSSNTAVELLKNCYSEQCDSILKQVCMPKIDSIKTLPFASMNVAELYRLTQLIYRDKREVNSRGMAIFETLQYIEQQGQIKPEERNKSLQRIKDEIDSLQVEYDEDVYTVAMGYTLASRYGELNFKNSSELYEASYDLTGKVRGFHNMNDLSPGPYSDNYETLECIFYYAALSRKLECIQESCETQDK